MFPEQAAAKGVQGCEDTRQDAFLLGKFKKRLGGQAADVIQQVPVITEQLPEHIGHGKGDVLPARVRQDVFLFLNPLVSEFLATGRAQAALAAEADFFVMAAIRAGALVAGIAQYAQPTGEHTGHTVEDGRPHPVPIFLKESPPPLPPQEQLFHLGGNTNNGSPQVGYRQ